MLWTNSSPSTAFAAQTISLDLSSYKMVRIIAFVSTDNPSAVPSTDIPIGQYAYLVSAHPDTTSKIFVNQRGANVTESGIIFAANTFATVTYAPVTDNTKMIPYQIYGIK